MGKKNKLAKFADMETYECVFQYPFARLVSEGGFPLRGHWRKLCFGNNHPIVLELGCGKGEYTIGLAQRFADTNFIGIDIKGARMWTGAKQANEEGINNVAFLRTDIGLLHHFFAPDEVNEVWITFPDPQMKKVSKRLTGTHMLSTYRQVMTEDGLINLKTDSPFLYQYTMAMAHTNAFDVITSTDDLYATDMVPDVLREIRTHYEQQWLDRGKQIKYLSFRLPHRDLYAEPDIEIEPDDYRSYNRSRRSANPKTSDLRDSD